MWLDDRQNYDWKDYTTVRTIENIHYSTGVYQPPERKQLVGLTDNVLFFWQLNLQHGKTSTAVLTENLTRDENVAILVQEPWVRDNKILGLQIRNCSLLKGTNQQNPHACIITKWLRK